MAKINQIQQKLLELDGGAFQKLADSYLLKKGYQQINPIGSVIGSNKVRKGTPDTLIPLPNGKYIFAEYSTTQEPNIFGKFMNDLDKCFDANKTGIPAGKIQEVVLCHTTEFSPAELEKLRVECEKHGANLNVFGIGAISYDLLEKFPGIAKDHLGVEVDTRQIVDMDRFITLYGKNRLATRLDTTFHFREDETKEIEAAMEENDLVIISGQTGVGKSRLALECCRGFTNKHPSFEVQCIFNRGVDLFEDIRVYFSAAGNSLIFVDDANRVSGFQYLIQLLQDREASQHIKIIVTVRDYALDKIRRMCEPYGSAFEKNILPFSNDQIRQLVEKEYGIKNHLYLDRIVDISQGSPRLAIMASEVAKEKNTLESIADVSELYDKYYESVRNDLDDLENALVLKVAGIVAFFRSIDRSHREMMAEIERVFGISESDFWEVVKILHSKEIFDMYENEVVKVSDQVLATYLFYSVFFKKGILDFELLLSHLFPRYRQRFVDAINPVLSAFNTHEVVGKMQPAVDKMWDALKNDQNENNFLQLIEVFWFWKQTDTLLYIKEKIAAMEPKSVEITNIKFEPDSNTSAAVLHIIGAFKNAEVDNFKIAIDLLFDYLLKQPENVPQVLRCLIDKFGFDQNSYLSEFQVQKIVIEYLWERSRQGKDIFFGKLFVAVAEKYLHTHFSSTKAKHHSITVIDFDLPNTPPLRELRKTIWGHLFQLNGSLREDALSLLYRHPRAGFEVSVKEIVRDDSAYVLQFFEKQLEPSNIWHCFIVHGYLKLLSRLNLPFSAAIKERFESETYLLYDLLASDWIDKQELELGVEEYERYRKEKIREHFKSYGVSEYDAFLRHCKEINERLTGQRKEYSFSQGFVTALVVLSEKDTSLYADFLTKYLQENDFLNVNPYVPVRHLIDYCGSAQAYKILSEPSYSSKRRWLFSYYQALPVDEITLNHLEQLYELFEDAEIGDFLYDLDFLLRYRSVDEKVVVKVVKIVLDKAENEPKHASLLSQLSNPYSEINKEIMQIFSEDIILLEDAYITFDKADPHADFEGHTFSQILDIDPSFVDKYIDDRYKREKWLSRYDDMRDYSFIWKRDDYEKIMNRIIHTIFEHEKVEHYLTYLDAYFGIERNRPVDRHETERQDNFLGKLILERHEDGEFMQFLFSMIANFPTDRRHAHVTFFLKHNNNFDDFKELPLEPLISGWSGSAVPMLQKKIDYYESLLSVCDTVDLLKHKQYLEQRISNLHKEIEREKKRDFTEDDGIPLT
jgi:hypothetical protein